MRLLSKWTSAAAAAIVTTMITSGVALAGVQERPQHGPGPGGPLAEADANKDGEVTHAEWLKVAADRFQALDSNKDGKIVWSELPRPPRNMDGPRGGRGGPRGERGWNDMPPPPPPPPPGAEQPGAAPKLAPTSGN